MKPDPRKLSLDIFLAWEKSNLTLDICIEKNDRVLNQLSLKDRRLFNVIVFGVFRHRKTLDWIIQQHARSPLKAIKLPILYILRSAVFQLHFLDKIPAFAAIDTAVTMAKSMAGRRTSGFVNAVLRKISTSVPDFQRLEKQVNPAEFISTRYALPLWLAKDWTDRFGLKPTRDLCRRINSIPDIVLRTNTLKIKRDKLVQEMSGHVRQIDIHPGTDTGIHLSGLQLPLHETDAFRHGWFQVQDEAAQMVSTIVNPQRGEKILDACAGLGGKTCHMAQLMDNDGSITAVDIEPAKLEALKRESQRLGIHIIKTRALNLIKSSIKDFSHYFDRVLVDAPCSGLGVLSRNPDAKWRRRRQDISNMAARQKKILNAASNLVRPGGILVYAVCSCQGDENEDVALSFINKRKDFLIDKTFYSDRLNSLKTRDGFFKTYPLDPDQPDKGMDGFFIARFKRTDKNQ